MCCARRSAPNSPSIFAGSRITMHGMRLFLALVIGLALASPAFAADAPKPKAPAAKKAPPRKAPARTLAFDGHYAGRLIPQGGAAGCGLHQVRDFEIDK